MPSEAAAARWLADIAYHINLARRFIGSQTAEEFAVDLLRLYAVTRCLEIISEASRRLPASLKERHPHIAWQSMAVAGNVYRHDYEDVIARIVWQTVMHDLGPLLSVVEQELATGTQ